MSKEKEHEVKKGVKPRAIVHPGLAATEGYYWIHGVSLARI